MMRTHNLMYTLKIFTKNAPTLAFENVIQVHGVIHGLYELCIFLNLTY